jgi:diaminopimelate decarboxylase
MEGIRYKFAVKANTTIEIIKLIQQQGFGADVVSIGEVHAALRAGVHPEDIVFAGMGKTINELRSALEMNIGYISIESDWEYQQIQELSADKVSSTRLLIRTNLNVDGSTHPYLTTGREENKFGIDSVLVANNYTKWQAESHLPIDGIQVHIGSQILDIEAFKESAKTIIGFVQELRANGANIDVVDFGGGVGVSYDGLESISLKEYGNVLKNLKASLDVSIFLEPGRYLVAPNGILCGTVIYHKQGKTRDFLITDIAMNDLIRPALYEAFHEIVPFAKGERHASEKPVDIVGPICESGDFIGLNRKFPVLATGDHVLVNTAGAYGYSMASNYNLRPKPAEVLVEKGIMKILRHRQKLEDYI